MAFQEIPIIDFAPMLGSDPAAKRALAAELRAACTEIGFFYIKNHGVAQTLIDATFAECPRFFGLPLEEKMAIHVRRSKNNSGYTPLLEENTDPTAKGDLHEAFDIAHELPESDPDRVNHPTHYGPNQWPAGLAGFQAQLEAYYAAMLDLGQRLFSAFALALDLPEDYFAPLADKPTAIMRIISYPSQDGPIDPKQIGIGAHSDYECFTILCQETVPALQVQNQQGEWVDAPPIRGTFVINIGDQMARWTNDLFASTVHRAMNVSGRARYSIPCFVGSNFDTLIKALPGTVTAERPAKYPPVLAGDYVQGRLDATYAYRQEGPETVG
ncbi:MAG TPA: 2-oxoglutarate and iron-dependent oxygenase domain-containing protein [Acidisoma sp.]|uniref:isopenicillin N synthase family dioxygenase n=1 Tax=Acidisoma sp. TaxID=1872115 RepID=UPI002D0CF454|nr:2-oxoglutarate and iron-dependent oxygenase domain-containing protein [Acidisoma sp.]HTI02307.1 2-oxoglutarate and iron-dependent oxygenase domain-containing protein [Acidisoma sp.]